MTRARQLLLLATTALLACTIPSAYDQAYERESTRLDSQARSDHAEASSYAAVVYFETGSAVFTEEGLKESLNRAITSGGPWVIDAAINPDGYLAAKDVRPE